MTKKDNHILDVEQRHGEAVLHRMPGSLSTLECHGVARGRQSAWSIWRCKGEWVCVKGVGSQPGTAQNVLPEEGYALKQAIHATTEKPLGMREVCGLLATAADLDEVLHGLFVEGIDQEKNRFSMGDALLPISPLQESDVIKLLTFGARGIRLLKRTGVEWRLTETIVKALDLSKKTHCYVLKHPDFHMLAWREMYKKVVWKYGDDFEYLLSHPDCHIAERELQEQLCRAVEKNEHVYVARHLIEHEFDRMPREMQYKLWSCEQSILSSAVALRIRLGADELNPWITTANSSAKWVYVSRPDVILPNELAESMVLDPANSEDLMAEIMTKAWFLPSEAFIETYLQKRKESRRLAKTLGWLMGDVAAEQVFSNRLSEWNNKHAEQKLKALFTDENLKKRRKTL
jgi:hypothetical protein